MKTRCEWCGDDALYVRYHDREWGVPVKNDRKLFEFLVLEGAQAGLSWLTILKKREGYRQAFDGFDFNKVARYDENRIESLVNDPGIIRNRLKIRSAVKNAGALINIRNEYGTFKNYIWSFVDHEQVRNSWHKMDEIPASTGISDIMSADLKRRGFSFVGTTICYAFMQATGMVNDHITSCFRYSEV